MRKGYEMTSPSNTTTTTTTETATEDTQSSSAGDQSNDEDRAQLRRESEAIPGADMISIEDGPKFGYAGQVPDETPNAAYGFPGSDEAAEADRASALPRSKRAGR